MGLARLPEAAVGLAILLICAYGSPLAVGQTVVSIDATGFQPNQITIPVGSSILWLNLDSASTHTTTSDKPVGDPDYWNVSLPYFQFYTRTFVRAGTFPYHDNVSGFTATVIVTAPQLGAPRLANGWFIFDATGLTAGRTNVVQSSTTLTTWSATQTNVAPGSSMTLSNAITVGPKFFRLLELP